MSKNITIEVKQNNKWKVDLPKEWEIPSWIFYSITRPKFDL